MIIFKVFQTIIPESMRYNKKCFKFKLYKYNVVKFDLKVVIHKNRRHFFKLNYMIFLYNVILLSIKMFLYFDQIITPFP